MFTINFHVAYIQSNSVIFLTASKFKMNISGVFMFLKYVRLNEVKV
jgi:hypothetical protein